MRHGSSTTPTQIHLAVLSAVALALSACSDEDTPSPFEPPVDSRPVASVWIHPSVHTHSFSHDTVRIRATALDSLGYGIPGKHFDWTSSDTALLTVDSTGLVFTRAKGTAYVVAQTAGLSDTAQVTVDPGVVLSNECLRCHWQDNQTGHLAWGSTR